MMFLIITHGFLVNVIWQEDWLNEKKTSCYDTYMISLCYDNIMLT
jgi:hypothetical protein